MSRALLVIALLLMSVSATSPLWVDWARTSVERRSGRVLVSGRVTGDVPDSPWAGTVVSLGSDRKTVAADGTFSFAALPGTHILRVCCSIRFQSIYREVVVGDSDVHLELDAKPLLEISGRIILPGGAQFEETVKVSAWKIGTNRVDRTVVYSDGSFFFHLVEGDWRIDLERLPAEYKIQSMTLDGREIRDSKFTISSVKGPSLPLQITLK